MLAMLARRWAGARTRGSRAGIARNAAATVCFCVGLFVYASPAVDGSVRASGQPAQPVPPSALDRAIADLLQRIEAAATKGDPQDYLALLGPDADRESASTFATLQIRPGVTRAVVRERDRLPITDVPDGTGFILIVDSFIQFGDHASVATWRLDVRRYDASGGAATPGSVRWLIHGQDRLTVVEGLYKLNLKATRQFRINNLKITSEDLAITIPAGFAYAADSTEGSTALVLVGDGEMAFSPKPAAERGQVKLFAGEETLRTRIRSAFVRVNPFDLGVHLSEGGLSEEKADPRSLDRAQSIFDEQVGKSFGLDLSDLSRETWSLVPPVGDFLAEIGTTRFGTLTYTQATNESEDISLFDRHKRRNISAYASARKLATRGKFYTDDEQVDYVVQHYDIQTNFSPERDWLEGRTVLRLRVRSYMLGTLTLRLADSLAVHSVTSPRFGRLLSLRVKGQNSVLINLSAPLARGDEITVAVSYAGRLETATPEREVLGLQDVQEIHQDIVIPPEKRTIYTNRSYWYPQSPVPTYATAQLRLTVPDGVGCVASGTPAPGNPGRIDASDSHAETRQLYSFTATQPARYFAVVLTRLSPPVKDVVRLAPVPTGMPSHVAAPPTTANGAAAGGVGAGGPGISFALSAGNLSGSAATPQMPSSQPGQPTQPARRPPSSEAGQKPTDPDSAAADEKVAADKVFYSQMDLSVLANPRQAGRARNYLEQAVTILTTYANILHDLPYPSFNLALVDDPLPGGHSPAYFAVLHQPLPMSNYSWRNDPVNFDRYPQFFIAHELAHQFWGDAVGGENYHEQWISEGFAQYFAVLYAERTRSKETFEDILRQLRRSSASYDHYGPVWLGYRLGHLQGDSRIFRALVYNKGALVLHMLRRLVGDQAFFRGMRRFYQDSRFKKVGTDDVRKAFEAESGQPLQRFFERWILEAGIPQVSVNYAIDPDPARPLHMAFEQKGEIYDFPITVRLHYASGEEVDTIVAVTDRNVERTLPLKGRLESVEINPDDAALVDLTVTAGKSR